MMYFMWLNSKYGFSELQRTLPMLATLEARIQKYHKLFVEGNVSFGTHISGLKLFLWNMFDTNFPVLFSWRELREESRNQTTVVSEMPLVYIHSQRPVNCLVSKKSLKDSCFVVFLNFCWVQLILYGGRHYYIPTKN